MTWLLYLSIFTSIHILIALWIGQVTLHPLILFPISIISTVYIKRRFPFHAPPVSRVSVIIGILTFLFLFGILIFNNGYPASADPFHTVIVRVFSERIASSFPPYHNYPQVYPYGFHVFAKSVSDILFFIRDYRVLWLTGALFFSLLPVIAGGVFTGASTQSAALAAVLFLGQKVLFSDFFYGMYPELLGIFLVFSGLTLYRIKSPLWFIPWAATIAVHPTAAVIGFIIFSMLFLLKKDLHSLLVLIFSPILALPVLVVSYSAIFQNMLAHPTTEFGFHSPTALLSWIGIGTTGIAGIAVVTLIPLKKRENIHLLSASAILGCIGIAAFTISPTYSWKYVRLVTIAIWMISIISFDTLLLFKNKFGRIALGILVGILVVSTFFSKTIRNKIRGDKISTEEIRFAYTIKPKIPRGANMLYAVGGRGPAGAATSLITESVPFTLEGYFLPVDPKPSGWDVPQDMPEIKIRDAIVKSKNWEDPRLKQVEYLIVKKEDQVNPASWSEIVSDNSLSLYKRK